MPKVAIYSRKSVYIEGSVSIQTQIEMCKDYAIKKYNNVSFEVFEDEGFSGGNTNRPAFQKLLKAVSLKQFDIVICYKIDRIARNTLDFLNTLETFKKNNVDLISISEGFDPNTQMGKVMLTLLASFAEMERSNIQQRVKDNMLSIAKSGRWTGGSPPIGFKIGLEGGLEFSSPLLIKTIYEMKYSNFKNSEIITNIQNEYGHKFSNTTLATTLKRPVYVRSTKAVSVFLSNNGYKVLGVEDNVHSYLTYTDNNIKYAVVSNIEGLIEPSIWIKVNKDIKSKNSRGTNRFNKDYWLTKTIICPICGKTYAGQTKNWNKTYTRKDGTVYENSNTYHYYMCRDMLKGKLKECTNTKRINREHLEEKIERYIYSLKDKETFKSCYSIDKKSNVQEIKKLTKLLKSKETAINNLVDKLSLLSESASSIIINKIESLSKEITHTKLKINTLELEDMDNTLNNEDIIYENIKLFNKEMNVEQKRAITMNIFEKIIYEPNEDSFKVYFN